MKILVLSYLFPFPVDSGYKNRVYNTIKQLSRKNEVDIFCFYDGKIGLSDTDHIRSFCKNVWTMQKPQLPTVTKIFRYLKNIVTKVPCVIFSAWDKEKNSFLNNILNSHQYDVIIAEHLIAGHILYTSYLPDDSLTLKIIVNHNIESDLFRSIISKQTLIKKPFNSIQYLFLRQYEKIVCEFFDLCVVMSSLDKIKFTELCPGKKFIELPNGVDIDFFLRRSQVPSNKDIYYVGSFKYFPNVDAVHYFIGEIFPIIIRQIPKVRFFILGGNPPEEIKRYDDGKKVFVLGYQEDIRTITSQCRVSVVPLQLGSGTRLKITEAMSMGIPVVSTGKGAEGLNVEDGKNIFIANSPELFAKRTLQLLQDYQIANVISKNSRALMEKQYSWERMCNQLVEHINKTRRSTNRSVWNCDGKLP